MRVPTHPNDVEPTRGYSALGVAVSGGHTNFEGAYDHSLTTPHNPMMDEHGRVWMTTRLSSWRPEYCPEGSQFGNSYTMYDPETGEMDVIPTCFRTHHLEFSDGPEGRLWSCTLGYLDTNTYDPKNPLAAQGWADFMADSDGDGQGDTQINRGGYGVYPSPGWFGLEYPGRSVSRENQSVGPGHGEIRNLSNAVRQWAARDFRGFEWRRVDRTGGQWSPGPL